MNTSSEILSLVVTTRDRATLIDVIEKIESSIYKQDSVFDLRSVIEETDNPELADEVIGRVVQEKDKKMLIAEIKNKFKSMRLLRLTLGTYPTRHVLKKIGTWVKKNIGEDVVIDWSIESKIVAGVKISFDGKYGDYGLNTQLDKWWGEKGEQAWGEVGL